MCYILRLVVNILLFLVFVSADCNDPKANMLTRQCCQKNEVKIKKITEPVILAEGPHWDPPKQALYFTSMMDQTINKYDFATKKHTWTRLDGYVSLIIPVEGKKDQFLVTVELEFLIVKWDGKNGTRPTIIKRIGKVDQDVKPVNVFNDGTADAKGRIFAVTIDREAAVDDNYPRGKANMYRLDGAKIKKVESNLDFPNGIAFDQSQKAMYYSDTLERKIRRYDYNEKTAEFSNMKYIFDFKKHNITGSPDGITVDVDGNIWAAVFAGSSVININPRTGELIRKITLGASEVTSVVFGGPNHDILFVTTARLEANKSLDGSVFMITGLCVTGHPAVNYKM